MLNGDSLGNLHELGHIVGDWLGTVVLFAAGLLIHGHRNWKKSLDERHAKLTERVEDLESWRIRRDTERRLNRERQKGAG